MVEQMTRPLTLALAAWRRLRAMFGAQSAAFVVLVGVSIGAGLMEAGVLAVVAEVATAMVVEADQLSVDLGPLRVDAELGLALALALVLALVRLVLQLLVAWLPARIASNVQAQLRADLFDAYSRASWSLQSEEREGHLQELMTNQINQTTQVVAQLVTALSGGSMFLALVAVAFALNTFVALIVVASAIVLFWVLRPIARLGRRAARDLSQAHVDHAAGVSESARFAEEAQVFGAAAASRVRIGHLIEAVRRSVFRFQLAGSLVQNLYQSLVIILVIGGLAALHVTGTGAFATLGAVVLILVRAASYGQRFQGGYQILNQLVPYLDRLDNTLSQYRSAQATSGKRPLPEIKTLSFDNATFAYRVGRPVLRGITFSVRAGEVIGIVGPSGAGKSTLVQLLLRLREPESGLYLINGVPANLFRRADWQRRVSYVPQEPRILHASVTENIRFFRDVNEAAVKHAARLAHIHEEITRFPNSYDTVIGQRADAVSGGQRQRICLARALVAKPDILVLDEPTSALDMASETAVKRSLSELEGEVTLLIVAHRPSTLSTCDRVLVLEGGIVEAFGPAAELERSNPFYRRTIALAGGLP